MASLHKDPRGKSPFWYGAYSVRDGLGVTTRKFRSTGTASKREAEAILATWVKTSNLGDRLTPDRAREIIAGGVADVMAVVGTKLETMTVDGWLKTWLDTKSIESEPSTVERYTLALDRLRSGLGPKLNKPLETLTVADIATFRNSIAARLSPASANVDLKIVRACLNDAVRHDLLSRNVASRVKTIDEANGGNQRRAFTAEEVRRVLEVCTGEWRGMVLAGVYTGQRLGDIAAITWNQIDLERGTIRFQTRKTGTRLELPLAKPLRTYVESLPAVDDPSLPVFPNAADAAAKRVGTLSNRFYDECLVPAGLAIKRSRKGGGDGRGAKRTVNALTFHSFRHSLTTWLKASGASNAIAMNIVGHDSEVVSRQYTHIGAADALPWMNKLPDVTTP